MTQGPNIGCGMLRMREKKRKKNRLNGAQIVKVPTSPTFHGEKIGHLYVRSSISTFADIYLGLYLL